MGWRRGGNIRHGHRGAFNRRVVVVCKTDPSDQARGISPMLVEIEDWAGFRVGPLLDNLPYERMMIGVGAGPMESYRR